MKQIQEIKRIKTFLAEYNEKSLWLQEILKPQLPFYKDKLMRLYVNVSKHPHPNECL